jgi:hypothetical protein
MKDNPRKLTDEEQRARLRRHQAQCSVCRHPQCQEIEEAWMNWANTTLLAKDYGVSRDAVYRHMRALDLFKVRQQRVKIVYEKILERMDMVSVNGATLLAALKDYTALLKQEEAERASTGASQEVSSPISDLEPAALAKDESLPEEATPVSSEGETGAAAVGNQEGEQGATPVTTQDVQNVEPTTAITVQ